MFDELKRKKVKVMEQLKNLFKKKKGNKEIHIENPAIPYGFQKMCDCVKFKISDYSQTVTRFKTIDRYYCPRCSTEFSRI